MEALSFIFIFIAIVLTLFGFAGMAGGWKNFKKILSVSVACYVIGFFCMTAYTYQFKDGMTKHTLSVVKQISGKEPSGLNIIADPMSSGMTKWGGYHVVISDNTGVLTTFYTDDNDMLKSDGDIKLIVSRTADKAHIEKTGSVYKVYAN